MFIVVSAPSVHAQQIAAPVAPPPAVQEAEIAIATAVTSCDDALTPTTYRRIRLWSYDQNGEINGDFSLSASPAQIEIAPGEFEDAPGQANNGIWGKIDYNVTAFPGSGNWSGLYSGAVNFADFTEPTGARVRVFNLDSALFNDGHFSFEGPLVTASVRVRCQMVGDKPELSAEMFTAVVLKDSAQGSTYPGVAIPTTTFIEWQDDLE